MAKKTVGKTKRSEDLPKFLVQHTEDEQFFFCIEIKGVYQCWRSLYPPSMDSRYKRSILKASNQTPAAAEKETKARKLWDRGKYTIGKTGTKKEIELAFLDGLSKNKLSFLLDGKKLKGRFIIHYDKQQDATLIYKQKDRFEEKEDPLETELQRSMNKWVKDYDPNKVPLKKAARPERKPKEEAEEEPVVLEEETARPTKKQTRPVKQKPAPRPFKKTKNGFRANIDGTSYEFDFYRPRYSQEDVLLCEVRFSDRRIMLKRKGKGPWISMQFQDEENDLPQFGTLIKAFLAASE